MIAVVPDQGQIQEKTIRKKPRGEVKLYATWCKGLQYLCRVLPDESAGNASQRPPSDRSRPGQMHRLPFLRHPLPGLCHRRAQAGLGG